MRPEWMEEGGATEGPRGGEPEVGRADPVEGPPEEPVEGKARRGLGRHGPTLLVLLPLVAVVAAVGGLVGFNPALRGEFLTAWDLLWDGEPEALQQWLQGFGFWAPLVSTLLQVATSIFPPGPSFLLALANAAVFGPVWGGLLTFFSALLAAGTCFGLARVLGRPGVERFVSPERLQKVDRFMARRGMLAVFLGRLIPFINPDLVSYAAGVTGIRWIPFLTAMAAGTVPSTLFYTAVGTWALEATGWVLAAVAVSTVVPFLALIVYRRRMYRRGRGAGRTGDGRTGEGRTGEGRTGEGILPGDSGI